jgi:hypothetical protein
MSLHPDALASTLARHIDLSNDRRQTLAVLILGLINARTVNLTHLAGAFVGPAKLSSNYRRLQRFFQYVRLDADWLARTLVALLRLAPPYRLCLDRTNWKVGARDINLLVLCIVTRRARIPVLWDILDRGGGSTMAQRQALIGRFIALFGKGSIKLLLADREFGGSQWIEFLVENDIPFAIRIGGRLRVRLTDGFEGPLGRLTRRAKARRYLMQARGCFAGMDARFAYALRFGVANHAADPIIVVTNRNPRKALEAYKSRWQIECLFAETKTRGFNMEDTRLTNPDKLSLLFALVALAMAWSLACATALTGRHDIPRAAHGFRRKSSFRTGFDALRNWIVHKPDIAARTWHRIWHRLTNPDHRTIRVV